jgi:hypothetical protein
VPISVEGAQCCVPNHQPILHTSCDPQGVAIFLFSTRYVDAKPARGFHSLKGSQPSSSIHATLMPNRHEDFNPSLRAALMSHHLTPFVHTSTVPQRFPTVPQMFPNVPRMFPTVPQMFPNVPRMFSTVPQMFPNVPRMFPSPRACDCGEGGRT